MTLLKKCKNNAGFTLMELLVVIVIIGIIGGIGGGYYLTSLKRGRDGQRAADLNNLRNALEMYYLDNNNQYPDRGGGSYVSVDELERDLISGSNQYIKVLPEDPTEGRDYKYRTIDGGDNTCYCLSAHMEVEDSWRTSIGGCSCPGDHGGECYLVTCP